MLPFDSIGHMFSGRGWLPHHGAAEVYCGSGCRRGFRPRDPACTRHRLEIRCREGSRSLLFPSPWEIAGRPPSQDYYQGSESCKPAMFPGSSGHKVQAQRSSYGGVRYKLF